MDKRLPEFRRGGYLHCAACGRETAVVVVHATSEDKAEEAFSDNEGWCIGCIKDLRGETLGGE